LIIRVNDITDRVRRMTSVEQIEDHKPLLNIQEEGVCSFLSPVSMEFSAVREFDHIRVEGLVSASARVECSRCLAQYDTELRSLFTIFYSKASVGLHQDEEVELGERELVSATYEGDEIDLSSEVTEHLLMELPLKPLCREDCQGLCSSCGTDLNLSDCGCSGNRGSFAFSALKDFKLDR
jgi:uncharacterized protein